MRIAPSTALQADSIDWGTPDGCAYVQVPPPPPSLQSCADESERAIKRLLLQVLDQHATIRALADLAADLAVDNFNARRLAKDERRLRVHAEGQMHRLQRATAERYRASADRVPRGIAAMAAAIPPGCADEAVA